MARKKKPEEHVNHERWLVSYADFITLLFAFFVVMYSMSSVNEGKYRVLSDSMVSAFRPTTRSLSPIQIGELVRSNPQQFPLPIEVPRPPEIVTPIPGREDEEIPVEEPSEEAIAESEPGNPTVSLEIEAMGDEVADLLEDLVEDEQIELRRNALWLEIEIKSSILFTSGSADLAPEAREILTGLGVLFSRYPNPIAVEGFTDDRPIRNSIFPSNWELSTARSASVVRLFQEAGVDPVRMSSVGYAEFRPRDTNETEVGRSQNRRVVVVVMANTPDGNERSETPFSDIEMLRQSSNFSQDTQISQ